MTLTDIAPARRRRGDGSAPRPTLIGFNVAPDLEAAIRQEAARLQVTVADLGRHIFARALGLEGGADDTGDVAASLRGELVKLRAENEALRRQLAERDATPSETEAASALNQANEAAILALERIRQTPGGREEVERWEAIAQTISPEDREALLQVFSTPGAAGEMEHVGNLLQALVSRFAEQEARVARLEDRLGGLLHSREDSEETQD